MADLLDIAPAAAVDVVMLGDGPVDVRRLGFNDIAALVMRFPTVLALLAGGDDTAATALMGSPGLAAIIAAGCGHIGDEKSEAIAGSLSIEEQFKLLNAILRLTFPNGLSSVMQEVGDSSATHRRSNRRAKGSQDALETFAVAVTALIRRGFPPDYAMNLSPRQIMAYLELNDRLDRIDLAKALAVALHGAQGDPKAVEKMIKELSG